jgi:hypothetical protein
MRKITMRNVLAGLALVVALAVPAAASAASAQSPGGVICDGSCDGGGINGWTGCTTTTGTDSGGVSGIAGWRHYLVVSYCKDDGLITSLSIAAHGCDTSGFAFCNVGPAWVTSGGVGTGWAYLEGHAYYGTTLNRFAGLNYTSVVHVWIWMG